MTSDINGEIDPALPSIIRPRIARRIDELLDLAIKDREEGIRMARRLREWLKRQGTYPAAHRDIPDVIKEIDVLIETFRKE